MRAVRGPCSLAVVLGVVMIVGLGCGHPHPRIRYGSLQVGDRSFSYGHGIESFALPNGLVVALSPEPRASLI
jgi:hypothetical protein